MWGCIPSMLPDPLNWSPKTRNIELEYRVQTLGALLDVELAEAKTRNAELEDC